ncbi:hypothetical protein ACHAQH_002430 [Verticillium albo-atrum]
MHPGIELGIERVGDGRYSLRLIPTKNGQDVYDEQADHIGDEIRLDERKADDFITKLLSEGNNNEVTAGKVLRRRRTQLANNLSPLQKVSEAREWYGRELRESVLVLDAVQPGSMGSQRRGSQSGNHIVLAAIEEEERRRQERRQERRAAFENMPLSEGTSMPVPDDRDPNILSRKNTIQRSLAPVTPSTASSQAPLSHSSDHIIVQVGERRFETTRTTLRKSLLLHNLLSHHPTTAAAPLFLDADPTSFADLLTHLRTALYPLFWSVPTGHDLPRYAALHTTARHFYVKDLESWLARKAYLSAVTVDVRIRKVEALGRQPFHRQYLLQGHQTLSIGAAVAGREVVWTCPAGKGEHDGDSLMCEVEGCCGSMLTNSAKDRPEQRVLMDVVKVFTEERTYSVNERVLWSWEEEAGRGR